MKHPESADEFDTNPIIPEAPPVGAPELPPEPGDVGFGEVGVDPVLESAASDDSRDQWRQWEAEHAGKKMRLAVIVGLTMAGIVGLWFFSLGSSLKDMGADSAKVAELKNTFFDQLASYENSFNKAASVSSTGSTPVNAKAPVKADGGFVESLKIKAVQAATSTK